MTFLIIFVMFVYSCWFSLNPVNHAVARGRLMICSGLLTYPLHIGDYRSPWGWEPPRMIPGIFSADRWVRFHHGSLERRKKGSENPPALTVAWQGKRREHGPKSERMILWKGDWVHPAYFFSRSVGYNSSYKWAISSISLLIPDTIMI